MTRYVVLVDNNDGGQPATIHESFDKAKKAVWEYLTESENDPPITDAERVKLKQDLANLRGEYVESIRGSDAWKEWVYVAPVEDSSSLE